ncbi:unnamed protein product [Lota lota]
MDHPQTPHRDKAPTLPGSRPRLSLAQGPDSPWLQVVSRYSRRPMERESRGQGVKGSQFSQWKTADTDTIMEVCVRGCLRGDKAPLQGGDTAGMRRGAARSSPDDEPAPPPTPPYTAPSPAHSRPWCPTLSPDLPWCEDSEHPPKRKSPNEEI